MRDGIKSIVNDIIDILNPQTEVFYGKFRKLIEEKTHYIQLWKPYLSFWNRSRSIQINKRA